jgi:hypothetical protein
VPQNLAVVGDDGRGIEHRQFVKNFAGEDAAGVIAYHS